MSDIFVTCRLMGGLGNQMFQIAHVLSQAKRNNLTAKFYPDSLTRWQGNDATYYIDNIYKNLDFTLSTNPEQVLRCPKWSFTPYNGKIEKSTLFDGYYQSHKNFYGEDDYIKDCFRMDNNVKKYILNKYKILEGDVTAVHIRRGDYQKFNGVHPIITLDYIKKGLSIIDNDNPILVFSDDKEWCEQNLDFEYVMVDEKDYIELWVMSLCKDFVTSNSSFSWWGSFLSDKDGKVVAPKEWFGPSGEKDFQDIYRDKTIII